MTTTIPDDRRWRPAAPIKASALLHAGALTATIFRPEIWPWTAGAVVADQAMLTIAGLWPRCSLLGPNLKRLSPKAATRGEIAITIDDGPDRAVTPTVLDLLDRYGVKATFFCIGERATRHPELCREIVERGHAVENHSLHHRRDFALLGLRGFVRELETAQETLAAITGIRPLFFRAPAGLRNPLLDPVLCRLGLRLVSWTRRGFDTRDGNAESVSARLLRGLQGGDILLLHDGNAARTAGGDAVILAVLPRLLEAIAAAKLNPVTLRSVTA
ncbi:MAG: polysaccharide deacetylase family protein [Gammaproteobacteria bacterium]